LLLFRTAIDPSIHAMWWCGLYAEAYDHDREGIEMDQKFYYAWLQF